MANKLKQKLTLTFVNERLNEPFPPVEVTCDFPSDKASLKEYAVSIGTTQAKIYGSKLDASERGDWSINCIVEENDLAKYHWNMKLAYNAGKYAMADISEQTW